MAIHLDKDELRDYFKEYDDISFAVLFGSFSTGTSNLMSDVDIAVRFEGISDRLALGERQIDITCAIMRMVRVNNVDVVLLNTANPFLKFQVAKNGQLLYAKDEKLFYSFKAQAFGEYQDIRPMYEMYDRLVESNLRRGAHG